VAWDARRTDRAGRGSCQDLARPQGGQEERGESTLSALLLLRDAHSVPQHVQSEVCILRAVAHPNLVDFHGVMQNWQKMYPFAIVSTWMPNGTITDFLAANPDHDPATLVSSP
jgi:serine/threonine protein kinase